MRHAKIAELFTVLAITASTIGAGASMASATQTADQKITICHATRSTNNPYVVITVDIASIIGDSGHGHSGVNIGDIIPPIPGLYEGNNWGAVQAATLANNCNVPTDILPSDYL